jgi:hypothetical protein
VELIFATFASSLVNDRLDGRQSGRLFVGITGLPSGAVRTKLNIFGFLKQSHISERNVARLEQMAKSDNPEVASLIAIVLDVARIKPYKTRRLNFLAHKHPELLGKLRDTGLILSHHL